MYFFPIVAKKKEITKLKEEIMKNIRKRKQNIQKTKSKIASMQKIIDAQRKNLEEINYAKSTISPKSSVLSGQNSFIAPIKISRKPVKTLKVDTENSEIKNQILYSPKTEENRIKMMEKDLNELKNKYKEFIEKFQKSDKKDN